MEPSWKVLLESYCVAKCVSCKINIHFPNCPWGGAPSAGVSNSMLWKDVRHKLKGERGCQGEKKSLQQPQNVTKQFLALAWDGPMATGLVAHVIDQFDRLCLSGYNVSAVFAEPLLPLYGFTENPVFITTLSFVSVDVSVLTFVLHVPLQLCTCESVSMELISLAQWHLFITTDVSDLAPTVLFGLNNP